MLKESKDTTLEYQRLSKEEMETRGILGRLVGVCADFFSPTRNGRKYPESLWENVFNDPIMKERIENGVCYGELGHPTDREETDMEKIALCLAEVPKKGSDGKLRAVFDILNTPNGRILKSLCDYGSTIGISSRGSGDLETDFDGNESVNPDTYTCEGFDAVLIPAVKEARLQYVTESLKKTRYNKTLRDKLTESINNEDEKHQKIMKESLNTLGIKLSEGGYNRVVYLNKPMSDGWEFSLSNKRKGSFEFNSLEELNDALKYYGLPQSLSKFNKSLYNSDNGYIKNSYQDWHACAYPPTDYGEWVEEPSVEILNESQYSTDEDIFSLTRDEAEKEFKSLEDAYANGEEVDIDRLNALDDYIRTLEQTELEDNKHKYDDFKGSQYVEKLNTQKNDTEYIRLKRAYKNAKSFKDIDAQSGEIRDLIDSLESSGKSYDIYENSTDNGCTVFYEKLDKKAEANAKFNDIFDESLGFGDQGKLNTILYKYVWKALSDYADQYMTDEEDFSYSELKKAFDIIEDKVCDKYTDKVNEAINQETDDINSEDNSDEVVNDESLVEELQKALRLNKKLDEKIIALQEKLSVGYAKEVKLNEQIEGYKTRIFKLSKSTNEVRALNEKLNTISKNKETIDNKCNLLTESINKKNKSIKSLKESVKKQSETINELNIKLTESINQLNSKSNELSELVDKYETLNKDMNQLKESYSHKLERQNELVERYKNIAKKSVDKYIDTQATRLGIRTSEIKNRLPESYSFKDIDSICEDLQTYKLNMSNLPFSTNSILHEGMNIKASNVSQKTLVPMEEDIDELTLRLAGLK